MSTAFSNTKRKFERKRLSAEHKKKLLKKQIYSKYPELEKIENELQTNAIKLAKNMFLDKESRNLHAQDAFDTLLAKRKMLLNEYNLNEHYLDSVYDCTICNDKGILDNGSLCKCFLYDLQIERAKHSGLEPFLENDCFDNFNLNLFSKEPYSNENKSSYDNMKELLSICTKYTNNFRNENKGMLLLGNTGTGKSFLLHSIGRALIENNTEVLYYSAFDLVDQISQFRFSRNHDESSMLPFKNTSALIIDDLGAEIISDYSKAELLNLLDYRMNHNKNTLFSSNLSLSEISNQYGSRFTSRLLKHFYIYKCLGADLRTKL